MSAFLAIMVPLAIAVYFIPTMVAAHRKASVAPVFLINFFTGWTTIGWVGALILAALAPSENRPRHIGGAYHPQLGPGFGAHPGHQFGPAMPHANPEFWTGHPGYPGFSGQSGHPLNQPLPGQAFPGPGPYWQSSPHPQGMEQWPDREFETDLPYGGFGSTPYGNPTGGGESELFGRDPFGRKPLGDDVDDDFDPNDR